MQANKVVAAQEVKKYLNNLIAILHKKEYFGFRESARKYVIELLREIETDLPKVQHKPAPLYFDRYGKGMYYAIFRKNKQHGTLFLQNTTKTAIRYI